MTAVATDIPSSCDSGTKTSIPQISAFVKRNIEICIRKPYKCSNPKKGALTVYLDHSETKPPPLISVAKCIYARTAKSESLRGAEVDIAQKENQAGVSPPCGRLSWPVCCRCSGVCSTAGDVQKAECRYGPDSDATRRRYSEVMADPVCRVWASRWKKTEVLLQTTGRP